MVIKNYLCNHINSVFHAPYTPFSSKRENKNTNLLFIK